MPDSKMSDYQENNPRSFDDYDADLGMMAPRGPGKGKNPQRAATGKNRADSSVRTRSNTPRPNPQPTQNKTSVNARTKAPVKARKPQKPKYGFADFLRDYRTHLAFGVLMFAVGMVMIGVSVSFFFNGQLDQSVMQGRTVSQVVNSGLPVGNAGGAVGASLARFLMVDTLGVGSLILGVYLILIGLAAMRAIRINFITLTFKSLYSAVAVSLILGLLTFNSEGIFHLGGNHGHHVMGMIERYAGALGAYAVALVLLGGLVAIYLNPLRTFFRNGMKLFRGVKQQIPEGLGDKIGSIIKPSPVDISGLDGAEEAAAPSPAKHQEASADAVYINTAATGEEPVETRADETIQNKAERYQAPDIHDLDAFEEKGAADEIPATVVDLGANSVSDPSNPPLTITNIATEGNTEHELEPVEERREIRDGDHLGINEPYDHRAELSHFRAPVTDILIERPSSVSINEEEQQENTTMIVNALRSFGVEIAEVKATVGPTVTLFEIVPAEGVKIAKIKNLEDDIAMNLAALGIRIIAPMPGKGTIGIEVPNKHPQIVGIRTVLESEAYARACRKMALPMAMGATISNDIFIADLTKMPHLLVAGATGQGKSVGLNAIITSLIYAKHPSELKFVLIDPKRVEFSVYKAIENHYMAKIEGEDNPIITDPMKAVATLQSLCEEMEQRYDLLSEAGVRDIAKYNERFCERRLNPAKGHRYLPYIVIIVDEFADLTMVAGKDVSLPIARIAQKARAVGMHMILATQRPSTDVITGMIKANFPGRIAFRVQQMVDSRTILDSPGANRLIGRGDMLFSNSGQMERVQCALVETEEIEAIVDCIGRQIGYMTAYPLPEPPAPEQPSGPVDLGGMGDGTISRKDDTFMQCARFAGSQTTVSTSMLQRKFKIGFNRAGRIMEDLQNLGIVGPPNGSNPRQVLMTTDEVEQVLANLQ